MNSAIYRGWVRHRRYSPKRHEFRYHIFMVLLDLDELDRLHSLTRLWSRKRFAPVSFRREDHYGDTCKPLKECVLDLVEGETGKRPSGAVMLLTNPRFWGYGFNPISVYYCYTPGGEKVAATVAEVTNTPWGERHCYVLPGSGRASLRAEFTKKLHVSPFMPMGQTYRWRGRAPGKTLSVHLESHQRGTLMLDATLALRRQSLSSRTLGAALLAHPFVTAKIIAAIHWQALRLWSKGLRIYEHPDDDRHDLRRVNN